MGSPPVTAAAVGETKVTKELIDPQGHSRALPLPRCLQWSHSPEKSLPRGLLSCSKAPGGKVLRGTCEPAHPKVPALSGEHPLG